MKWKATVQGGLFYSLEMKMERKTVKKRARTDPRRVVCSFLATPDADARLRRVYEILLRSAAAKVPRDEAEQQHQQPT